jgi:hypothetical protein
MGADNINKFNTNEIFSMDRLIERRIKTSHYALSAGRSH